MTAWTLRLELWLADLGRGTLIVAIAAVLAMSVWAAVPIAEQQSTREAARLKALQDRSRHPPANPPSPAADTLTAFESRLSSSDDVTRLMLQLWERGGAAGLQMTKVDYRVEHDAGAGFERLTVTLPMTGPYPAVRRFTFALMAEFPALSLDKLDMKRDQTASGTVETTVHLTLLIRP